MIRVHSVPSRKGSKGRKEGRKEEWKDGEKEESTVRRKGRKESEERRKLNEDKRALHVVLLYMH